MYVKQRLLRGGAPRAMDMLVCSADGNGDDGGGGSGGGGEDEAVKKLTAKVDELLSEKKKLAEKVRSFEATEAERKAKEAEAEDEAARKSKDWEKIETGYKDKLSKAEGEGFLWKSRYENLVIDRAVDEALDAAKIRPELRKAAAALLKSEHPPEMDGDGKASIDGKPIADFIGGWAKSDVGKAFIANGSSGGGANGSGNGNGNGGGGDKPNPWKAGSINLTEQGRLLKADRQAAIKLAAEAGVKIA